MTEEYESLTKNGTWEIVPRPISKSVIDSKWIFKLKHNLDGSIARHKCRLVARGYTQIKDIDFDNTFAPTLSKDALRILLSMAARNQWTILQCDVKTAFLYGNIDKELYLEQPEGFDQISTPRKDYVCKLNKALYGLKQAPRLWNKTFHTVITSLGLQQAENEKCIYFSKDENIFLGLYVDDILLMGNNVAKLEKIQDKLAQEFEMTNLGNAHHILGMQVTQTKTGTTIDQAHYTRNILKTFGYQNCKPHKTPMETERVRKEEEGDKPEDQKVYQQIVGSLLYLSTCCRPDITAAVNQIARFCSAPTTRHMTAVNRVMRYLAGTANLGLKMNQGQESGLEVYADSDWAGDKDDRKSTSGFVTLLHGNIIAWRSSKQQTVALSSVEAELIAASEAVSYNLWIMRLCTELGFLKEERATLYMDSQGAMALGTSGQPTRRTKHIEIKHYFVTNEIDNGRIRPVYVPTEQNLADIMTKGLDTTKFDTFRDKLSLTKCQEEVLSGVNNISH